MSCYIPPFDDTSLPLPAGWPIKVSSREKYLKFILRWFEGKPMTIAEIGVLHGDFSEMILEVLQPEKLHLIDPYEIGAKTYKHLNLPTAYSTEDDYQKIYHRFRYEIQSGQVLLQRYYSFDAVKFFDNAKLDMVYLDASHLYEDVKRDLSDWMPKLKPGGLMAGHDYTDNKDFGVMQAVDEFCKENNYEMILLNKNGGDFALIKKY